MQETAKLETLEITNDVEEWDYTVRFQHEDGVAYRLAGEMLADIFYLARDLHVTPKGLCSILREIKNERGR